MMGLFSRTSQADGDNEDFDDVDLPSSTDIRDNPLITDNEAPLDFKAGQRPAMPKLAYGVEEAIRLMKALPRDNNEVVVTVVKKTLESTNIQVEDIIGDATAKEERIRNQHKHLEKEIKNLQEDIAKRNQRISELLQDLKETTDVRQRLQLALELDTANNKTAEVGKTATSVARPESAAPSIAKPATVGARDIKPGGSPDTSKPVSGATSGPQIRPGHHRAS